MFWLRLSGWLFVLLLIATAAVMVLGSRLPAVETLSVSSQVHASPDRIWPLLSIATAQPQWRSDVAAVELLPDNDGLPCWSERHDRMLIPICTVAREAPRRLTLRIADSRLAFQGERSFTLVANLVDPSATLVNVSETISIAPPMVRFYEHYVFSEQSRLEQLLADLEQAAAKPSAPAR